MAGMVKAPKKQFNAKDKGNKIRDDRGKNGNRIFYLFFYAIMAAIIIISAITLFGKNTGTGDFSQKITGEAISQEEPISEAPSAINQPAKNGAVQETTLNSPNIKIIPGFILKSEIGDIRANALKVIDINKDNYPDAIIADVERGAFLYLNNRKAELGRSNSFDVTKINAISAGDFNNDGNIDVVLGVSADRNYVYYNEGDNSFDKGHKIDLAPGSPTKNSILSLSVGDFNNDGLLDIAAGRDNNEGNTLYINEKGNNFVESPQFGAKRTQEILFADFNNDGWQDVLSANYNEDSKIYFNRGTRKAKLFDESNLTNAPGNFIRSVALCDLNRDGWVDIVSANHLQQNHIYINNHDKTFTKTQFTNELRNSVQIVCADFNNDNWDDMIVINYNEPSYLYLNNRTGFIRSKLDISQDVNIIEAVDFNNDGFKDIILGRYSGKTSIMLNSLGKTY